MTTETSSPQRAERVIRGDRPLPRSAWRTLRQALTTLLLILGAVLAWYVLAAVVLWLVDQLIRWDWLWDRLGGTP